MNQTQLKYARERAHTIYLRRSAKIRENNTTLAVELTVEDKMKALKEGKFTLKSSCRYPNYLEDYITFNDAKPVSIDKDTMNKEMGTLDKEYNKITDELVLGDQEEALKLIRAFDV